MFGLLLAPLEMIYCEKYRLLKNVTLCKASFAEFTHLVCLLSSLWHLTRSECVKRTCFLAEHNERDV